MNDSIMIAWIVNGLAVLLSWAALLLNKRSVPAEQHEDGMFARMCLLTIVAACVKILRKSIYPVTDIEQFDLGLIAIVFIEDMLFLGLLMQWALFVDYMLTKSMDRQRLLLPRVYAALGVVAAAEGIMGGIALYLVFRHDLESTVFLTLWTIVSYFAVQMLELIFLIFSVRKMAVFRKRRKGPILFRGMPFVIPVFIGGVLSLLLVKYVNFTILCIGIGLFLLYLSMKEERHYVHQETGCFTGDYLEILKTGKRSYAGGLGILVTGAGDEGIAKILRYDCPEGMDVIRLESGKYYVAGERADEQAVAYILKNLEEDAKAEGLSLLIRHDLCREGESIGELAARLEGM